MPANGSPPIAYNAAASNATACWAAAAWAAAKLNPRVTPAALAATAAAAPFVTLPGGDVGASGAYDWNPLKTATTTTTKIFHLDSNF